MDGGNYVLSLVGEGLTLMYLENETLSTKVGPALNDAQAVVMRIFLHICCP